MTALESPVCIDRPAAGPTRPGAGGGTVLVLLFGFVGLRIRGRGARVPRVRRVEQTLAPGGAGHHDPDLGVSAGPGGRGASGQAAESGPGRGGGEFECHGFLPSGPKRSRARRRDRVTASALPVWCNRRTMLFFPF